MSAKSIVFPIPMDILDAVHELTQDGRGPRATVPGR